MPDSNDHELRELRQVFVTEAEQHLAVMDEGLVELEAHPDDAERLRTIFRSIHTIKGGASLVDLEAAEAVAHRAEDVLTALRDGRAPITGDVVSLLLRSVDALRRMTATVAEGGTPDGGSAADLVVELAGWRPDPTGDRAPAPAAAPEPQPQRAEGRSLRVDVSKLDRLLEVTDEIVLARRVFQARLRAAEGPEARSLQAAFEDDWTLFDELREAVMEMRMVPVGPVLRRFVRSARDTATSAGKQVQLVVEGEDAEVDTSIVERLVEPLTHLVRNAVDHGIEPPAARVAAGKDASGTVTLRARRDPGNLVVEVMDDGAGLSRERIVEQARDRGIPEPETLNDADLRDLLFEPGFSTAERVSDLSGRGVGMDAVRKTVEGLRGSVDISSREGAGTTVTLRMPLTLSVVDGLEVQVGDGTFIVPLVSVSACLDAPEAVREDGGVLELGDETVPWVRLRSLFAAPGEPPEREQMLLVRHAGLSACLVVDRLLGEAETTVRPLGPGLADLSTLGGSAVLRDGRIGLVLDVPVLLRDLVAGAGAFGPAPFAAPDIH